MDVAKSCAKRIRVLSVIDGLGYAGDETRMLNMSRWLDRSRFHHSVLTLNPLTYGTAKEYTDRKSQYVEAGIQVDDLAQVVPERRIDLPAFASRVYNKTGIFRRAHRLAQLVRKWDVDVIDAHLESAGLIGGLASRWTGAASTVTVYGGYTETFQVNWPWTTRATLHLVTTVITDSAVRAQQMRALLRNPSKVALIPNGIEEPRPKRTNLEMRRQFGLPEDMRCRIVGQVGRLIEYKGHDVLIRAARVVLENEPDTAFLLVGYPRNESYRSYLLALAKELHITDRVVITEYPGDIADVWAVIDIHAHASLFDSLPISITEGMALCKPAVVTSVGGIPEIVLHNETGLVVPPGDPEAMAEGILKLLRSPALASRLGVNARARYETFYRPDIMVRALEDHFYRLACCRRQGRLMAPL
ncbi:MAG: glycosyltransferase [Acidobacteriaceae bacterium]|nr:glycosyltransferase [Acidobacteriaceae bacterium]